MGKCTCRPSFAAAGSKQTPRCYRCTFHTIPSIPRHRDGQILATRASTPAAAGSVPVREAVHHEKSPKSRRARSPGCADEHPLRFYLKWPTAHTSQILIKKMEKTDTNSEGVRYARLHGCTRQHQHTLTLLSRVESIFRRPANMHSPAL